MTVDWDKVPTVTLDPLRIPPDVEAKATVPNNEGHPSLPGPGKADQVTLQSYRRRVRLHQVAFELARALTQDFLARDGDGISAHELFPQLLPICRRFVDEKVIVRPGSDRRDMTCSPYYGWAVEALLESIRPDESAGEDPELPVYERNRGPGTTADVSYWTSRPVREVNRSHLNYVVMDTRQWEQSASFYLDTSDHVEAFVKNAGLGFAIPYFHNGEMHDFVVDFIIRLRTEEERYLLIEVKGGREPEDQVAAKEAAAARWVKAVNADRQFGEWACATIRQPGELPAAVAAAMPPTRQ